MTVPPPFAGWTRTDALPILMYHRVASTGYPARDRWRMRPDCFEAQLKLLRDGGFESATFEEWRQASVARRSLPGRRVSLTFDDGFADFGTVAWPLLKAYGFKATVFLVTGSVGRWNTWDVDGEAEPLMGWDTILRLRDEGVEFGGHSVTHPHLTVLSQERIFAEAFESRVAIEERLQTPVSAFAYPYGEHDGGVRHVVGAAGFTYGVTCDVGRATGADSLLALPRIEVYGDAVPAELLRMLETEAPLTP